MESFEFDFDNICRLCKSNSESMRSIFETYDIHASCARFDEMLMACTAVSVNVGDNLPHQVCQVCIDNLQISFNFKQQCENTDRSLREYIKSFKTSDDNIKDEAHSQSQIDNSRNSEGTVTDDAGETNDNDIELVLSSNVKDPVKSDPDLEEGETSNIDYIQFLEGNQLLLTCRTCSKSFSTVEGMKCHKRIHTGSLFKCKECGKKYTRQNHLLRHEMSHSRRKVHVCKICNKTITRFEHLRRHLITHLKEKPFGCPTCNRGFNRSEHLANHSKRCKGVHVYICDICNKGFNREDSLEVHKHIHDNKLPVLPTLDNINNIDQHYVEIESEGMPDQTEPSDSETEADVPESIEPLISISDDSESVNATNDTAILENIENNENAEIYTEVDPTEIEDDEDEDENKEVYDESYEDGADMKEEKEDSDSGESEYLPKPAIKRKRGRPRKHAVSNTTSGKARGRPPLSKIKSELLEDDEGEFACPVCNEVFNKMNLLEKHALEHDGLRLHACTVCNKKFSRANHLRRHMLSHSEVKPFSCEICLKCFNRRDHLTQHLKLHYRSEDLQCDICKKPFGREEQLLKHKASKHSIGEKVSGEKKFQCPVCLKGFTTEKYRDIHMKGHNGEKTFKCRICHKCFLSKSHLSEHVKFHSDQSKKFLCSECGQRFIRNDYLIIHMRRHRGEKPFKCKFCGKGFPRTTDLTVHERYHTGEKTHLCTICGRGFGRAYNLTVHMRTHTGEKPYACTYCDAAFAQGNDLKAHVRRHTGERFQCELCAESFLMGYLLTQHKRTVHGLNVVSNIRRLQHVKTDVMNVDDPPITIPLPPPVIPTTAGQLNVSQLSAQLQAQMAIQQLQQQFSQ